MIGSLRGTLLDRGSDGELLIEVNGVGYRVQVTPSTSVMIGEIDGGDMSGSTSIVPRWSWRVLTLCAGLTGFIASCDRR